MTSLDNKNLTKPRSIAEIQQQQQTNSLKQTTENINTTTASTISSSLSSAAAVATANAINNTTNLNAVIPVAFLPCMQKLYHDLQMNSKLDVNSQTILTLNKMYSQSHLPQKTKNGEHYKELKDLSYEEGKNNLVKQFYFSKIDVRV